ncbi:MAG TPA: hypothetical protein VET48_08165 [Steroidobacteraceae bacterium]|nr:hypothetical protein [Steroidobacteraceae bacterium]
MRNTSPTPIVIENAVGPYDVHHESTTQGSLMVYSALNGLTTRDPTHPRHTNYDIYTIDGRLIQTIVNRSGSFAQDPLRVSLPAGKYQIVARAVNIGKVMLPVVIVAGRTTTVDLNKELSTASADGLKEDWVTLPN